VSESAECIIRQLSAEKTIKYRFREENARLAGLQDCSVRVLLWNCSAEVLLLSF